MIPEKDAFYTAFAAYLQTFVSKNQWLTYSCSIHIENDGRVLITDECLTKNPTQEVH